MGSLNTHLRELGPTPKSFDAALPASSLVLSSPARRSHVCACDCCCLASPPLRSRSAGRPSRSRWTACSSCAAAGAKVLEPFQFATPMVSGAAGAELGGTNHAHPPNFPRRSPHFIPVRVVESSSIDSAKIDVSEPCDIRPQVLRCSTRSGRRPAGGRPRPTG